MFYIITFIFHTSCTSFLSQLSSLTIIYFTLGVKSGSPAFLVAMSSNCRPPSHQSIFASCNFLHSLKNAFSLQCVLCVWYIYQYYPYTYNTYFPIKSEEITMKLSLEPCSKIHELTSWNVLKPFLLCMLYCTHFMQLIEKLVLEHVYHGQLEHLDKR